MRRIAFLAGDLLFLAAVGAATTWLMHRLHETQWSFAVCLVLGMLAAMLLQTVLAIGAAPLLGSIETMVSSMAVAMIAPMTVCALHLFDREPTAAGAAGLGALFGVGTCAGVEVYGAVCRRRLIRSRRAGGGEP